MKKVKKTNDKVAPKRKIDVLFDQYAAYHTHPVNVQINWVCIPLITFSVIGLIWFIPFPHMGFLGKYNGFVNWASFLIALSGYYYYRLSPVLSYMVILFVFVLALGVVQLEKLEAAGGPAVWMVCGVVFILSLAGQLVGYKLEGKRPSFIEYVKFLLIGPIWLLRSIWLRTGLSY